MDTKITAFVDTEIEKHKLHSHKKPILIDDVDINKIIVINKKSNWKSKDWLMLLVTQDFFWINMCKWIFKDIFCVTVTKFSNSFY